ncbi:MAG: hypothetical protein L0Y71_00450 [Gemmataceae bacterium]|nr:hypothetical protein [Gemmataceae bacterium]
MAEHQHDSESRGWPRWWRLVVIGVSTLVLCSCSAVDAPPPDTVAGPTPDGRAGGVTPLMASAHAPAYQGADAPRSPYAPLPYGPHAMALPPTGPFADPAVVPVAAYFPPVPEQVIAPPEPAFVGMAPPGPECIFDGGDRDLPARVSSEWIVQGLEPEDTIGHADRLDGSVIVTPSNRIKLYAPRFASVRSVTDLQQGAHVDAVVHHDQGLGPQPLAESLRLGTHLQGIEARGEIADKRLQGIASQTRPTADLSVQLVQSFDNGFLPYEDIAVIRRGMLENSDKPRLALGRQAANTWSHDLGVQAVINGQQAAEVSADQRLQTILMFEDKSGPAKLRVIKVASTSAANVGDIIDFTIRYDNVGDQVIGNVTIIDNLTTRLEYVEGSTQASRAANFSTKVNEAGSLVLRWEIIDPLPKGEGGLVRFKCRVR